MQKRRSAQFHATQSFFSGRRPAAKICLQPASRIERKRGELHAVVLQRWRPQSHSKPTWLTWIQRTLVVPVKRQHQIVIQHPVTFLYRAPVAVCRGWFVMFPFATCMCFKKTEWVPVFQLENYSEKQVSFWNFYYTYRLSLMRLRNKDVYWRLRKKL